MEFYAKIWWKRWISRGVNANKCLQNFQKFHEVKVNPGGGENKIKSISSTIIIWKIPIFLNIKNLKLIYLCPFQFRHQYVLVVLVNHFLVYHLHHQRIQVQARFLLFLLSPVSLCHHLMVWLVPCFLHLWIWCERNG